MNKHERREAKAIAKLSGTDKRKALDFQHDAREAMLKENKKLKGWIMQKVDENEIIERVGKCIRDMPEDEFIEYVNSILGTKYTIDDIEWSQ